MSEQSLSQTPKMSMHIKASKGWVDLDLKELWHFREVVYFLAWRDIKVRYKQTVFGASWAVLQPLITMVIFTIIFGRVAEIPSDGIPYPIFSYAALVPWLFVANGVTNASNSLVGGGHILKQIYFPRFAIPLSAIIGTTFDFILSFSVLLILMVIYGIVPTVNVIWLPLLVLLAFVTALGVSLVLTALNVQFRDIKHAVPFMVQAWMFVTPVIYPASVIDNALLKYAYFINPMAGVVEGFRWALLGTDTAPGLYILVSCVVALMILLFGAYYFKRAERSFADVV